MPLPYAQPPRQTTMPLPPSYAETIEAPTLHPRPQYNPDQNFTRSEVRIIHHIAYALGPNPVKMTCATCHTDIKTATISDHQPSAHICCVVLCLLGCCICSCLPYCLSTFMSVHHFCPNCKSYIGTWKR
ncbi:hypothetical protein KM043_007935 [Ampulex compressa]|nr:hypothetical protein KM043_007935 [Ampulex compressa]